MATTKLLTVEFGSITFGADTRQTVYHGLGTANFDVFFEGIGNDADDDPGFTDIPVVVDGSKTSTLFVAKCHIAKTFNWIAVCN